MRTHLLVALITAAALSVVATEVAHAQPGAAPPPPPVYAPPPPPPPGYAPPPPHYQPMPGGLSADDQRLLARGEISAGAHAGGGIASLFFGFGLGQAVQGRWGDTGWIFTVGETASIVAILVGINNEIEDCGFNDDCDNDNDTLIVAGIVGIIGFRVWELADAFVGPSNHNRKVRELRLRLGYPPTQYYGLAPYVAPTRHGGGVAGLTFRF